LETYEETKKVALDKRNHQIASATKMKGAKVRVEAKPFTQQT